MTDSYVVIAEEHNWGAWVRPLHLIAMADQMNAHIGQRRDDALARAWDLGHPEDIQ